MQYAKSKQRCPKRYKNVKILHIIDYEIFNSVQFLGAHAVCQIHIFKCSVLGGTRCMPNLHSVYIMFLNSTKAIHFTLTTFLISANQSNKPMKVNNICSSCTACSSQQQGI